MRIRHKKPSDVSENDVTPEGQYRGRRKFLMGAAGALGLGAAGVGVFGASGREDRPLKELAARPSAFSTDEAPTGYSAVTGYNNFYEFGLSKSEPAENAWRLQVKPWTVKVDGLVDKPADYALEDLIDFTALEERIYRLRCVEAWSMVVPWIGVPISAVLNKIGVGSGARFVQFQTVVDKKAMPGTRWPVLDWPYTEGLRLDEAMNPLAILAVGLYGKEMPNQNGAPIRLVVPWKYGFKSIKSINRITLTAEQPPASWWVENPREYGFFANVNPAVDHPRWSQATERRIGEFGRRDTLPFNGYADDVADLYTGMDLTKFI